MANLMEIEGRVSEALQQYDELLAQQPNNPLVLNNVAWILTSSDDPAIRDVSRAIDLAKQACDLTNYRLAPLLDTLAASFASAGRFDDAIRTMQQAIELAEQSGRQQRIAKLREKLKQYEIQRREAH